MSHGEGNGNPLQCSCLENPRDGGAWWAAVYGVAQSRTRLKRLSSSSSSRYEPRTATVGEKPCIIFIIQFDFLNYAQIYGAGGAQLCPTYCNAMDCSLSGSSAHGIFQGRILEWVAILFSRRSSQPRDHTRVSCIFCTGRQILYHFATWEAHKPSY